MLRELLTILKGDNPLHPMGENFDQMLQLSREMAVGAGRIFFERDTSPDDRRRIYESDVQVNKLERDIRKQVVAHLSIRGNANDLPYCLCLVSLVKDVERIGDYAKNLSELIDIHSGVLPDDDILSELKSIREGAERAFDIAADVFSASDRGRAIEFIRKGRDLGHRADELILRIARKDYDAGTAAVLVLASRYYKRFNGHVLNVLSSVIMPLHKIDYYDEDELPMEYK